MKKEDQFLEIIRLIKHARANVFRAANAGLINCYWQVGEYISKRIASASWGDKKVDELAKFIERNHPDLKGFNRIGLYRMKRFYETYSQSSFVSSPMIQLQTSDIKDKILAKIGWTHHLILISRPKSPEEREFYLHLCIQENYTVKELERQINSGFFERVMMRNQKLSPKSEKFKPEISNVFKSDYILEFLDLPKSHNETDLQKALIAKMKDFILELGKDFLFMGEAYRVQVGDTDFVIDLLFFHRGLQCMVAFELKADKFKPGHLGQLDFYLEALDKNVKKKHERPSIGILLCKDQDMEVVRFALNRSLSPAVVAAYQMQLPDKNVLQNKLREIMGNHNEREIKEDPNDKLLPEKTTARKIKKSKPSKSKPPKSKPSKSKPSKSNPPKNKPSNSKPSKKTVKQVNKRHRRQSH